MADADRDRLEPLRQLRRVEQHVQADHLAGALSEASSRQRALAQASAAAGAAAHRADQAQEQLYALTASGTTAHVLALAAAYARRCRHALMHAEAERDRAVAQHDASDHALSQARDLLAQARARRQVIERYQERARQRQDRLRDRRAP